jgi:hypothetical protein
MTADFGKDDFRESFWMARRVQCLFPGVVCLGFWGAVDLQLI